MGGAKTTKLILLDSLLQEPSEITVNKDIIDLSAAVELMFQQLVTLPPGLPTGKGV
jgi:hypothetical protein